MKVPRSISRHFMQVTCFCILQTWRSEEEERMLIYESDDEADNPDDIVDAAQNQSHCFILALFAGHGEKGSALGRGGGRERLGHSHAGGPPSQDTGS